VVGFGTIRIGRPQMQKRTPSRSVVEVRKPTDAACDGVAADVRKVVAKVVAIRAEPTERPCSSLFDTDRVAGHDSQVAGRSERIEKRSLGESVVAVNGVPL